ncbi:predicted protein [Chaetoceros tenuissimus]|uniref:Uncharacterized protein n=1 Tax=Chaetoceros tenuissimus TaxID=426638 RepID=A0AAD3H6V6_9STRA|nr:predicted protein [Chaetoceros tenuissimus]
MILSVRGGAGPLETTSAAKTFSSILAAQSTFSVLGGETGKDIWDMPDDNAFDNAMYLDISGVAGAIAVLSCFKLFFHMEHNTAVGYSVIPYAAQLFHKIITGKNVKAGVKLESSLFLMAIQSIVGYACFNKVSWAKTAMKLYGFNSLINAVIFSFAPKMGSTLWNLNYDTPTTESMANKSMGMALAAHAIAVLVPILSNVSVNETVGYTILAYLLGMVNIAYIAKDLEKSTLSAKVPFVWHAWVAVLAFCSASILL